MNVLTLQYNGVEETLEDWGFSAPELTLQSRARSVFTVKQDNADPAVDGVIPFEAQVVVYKDRVAAVGGGFTGGTIIFQGRRTDLNGVAQINERFQTLQFSDAWYDLEHIVFQHFWNQINPTPSPPPGELPSPSGTPPAVTTSAVVSTYFSRINLFQDISDDPLTVPSPWGYLTADQQIAQIIQYAQQQCGAALQLGVVDPAWNVLMYGVKAISCAEALLICLKTVPDAVTYFDYTTTPPTLHIRQRDTDWVDNTGEPQTWGTLPQVSLPYAGADFPWLNPTPRWHRSSNLKPRPDLQAPEVVLQYQQINTVNGQDWTWLANDAYPPGAQGRALRAVVAPIDLRGGKQTNVFGNVRAEAVDPTMVAFWKTKKPDLANELIQFFPVPIVNTGINDGTQDCITIVDHAGNPVSLAAFPNDVVSGQVAAWMRSAAGVPIVAKAVTITATLAYTQNQSTRSLKPVIARDKHVVSCRVKLTNSAVGLIGYSALKSLDPGEPAIFGLAKQIYGSLATLQWEGEHVIVEDNIFQVIGPGMTLNLKPGAFVGAGNPLPDQGVFNPAWLTMQAMISRTRIDFTAGRTEITIGPHKHLSAGELFELLMLWRPRFIYDNPNLRATGQDNAGGDVTLGEDTQKENTNQGVPQMSLTTTLSQPDPMTGYQTMVTHDAAGQVMSMQVVDATGATVLTQPAISLALPALGAIPGVGGAPATGRVMTIQPIKICSLATGQQKTTYIPMTPPE